MTRAIAGNGTRTSASQRHASIISAATALFAAKGFNGTTTKEIARTAGISEALVFKHFPTKRALYAAILAEKVQVSQLMDTVEDAAEKRDDARVFTLIASFRIHRAADPTFLRLLLFSALEGHQLSDMFFQKRHRVFYEYLAGYIRRRCQEGALHCLDPLLAAQAFIGMIVYHRILHEIFKVPLHCTPEEAVDAYVEVFLSGLRARPGGRGRQSLRRIGTTHSPLRRRRS